MCVLVHVCVCVRACVHVVVCVYVGACVRVCVCLLMNIKAFSGVACALTTSKRQRRGMREERG